MIFDIDGTVLPATSTERLFVRYLISKKILGFRHLVNFCVRGIALMPEGMSYTTKANKGYLRGFTLAEMTGLGREFFEDVIIPRISKKAVEAISRYQTRGKRVILLSGMPDFLLVNYAGFFGIDQYVGSGMEVVKGSFTGRTVGAFPLGKGKVAVLEPLVVKSGASWADMTFYGDHWLDRFLLAKVGHPVVVNPGRRLRRLAEKRGWRNISFK